MNKQKTLDKVRDEVIRKLMAENIALQSNGDEKELQNALAVVPESAMWNDILYMQENVLPRIAENKGVDSSDYKRFVQIRDSVIWAMYTATKYEKKLLDLQNQKMLTELYREKALHYERELMKFETAEEMITSESLTAYRNAIMKRAISMLDDKKDADSLKKES